MNGQKDKKINIIIADDNIDDQGFIKSALVDAGLNFEISSVYNGLQLMDFMLMENSYKNNENNIPDLVLLDIGMPFMNGHEVLREMQKHELLTNVPVYIISASHTEENVKISSELGARGFYAKPGKYEDYHQIIEEIISQNLFDTTPVV